MLRHHRHHVHGAPRGAYTHTSTQQRTGCRRPPAYHKAAVPPHAAQSVSSAAAHASRGCHSATADCVGCVGSSTAVAATGWQSLRCHCAPSPRQQQQQPTAAAARNACIAHAAGRGGRSSSSSRGGGRRGGGAGRGGSDSSDNSAGNSAWQDRLYAPDDFAEAVSNIVSTNAAKQRPPAQQQQPPQTTTRQAARTPSSKRAGSSQRAGGGSSSSSGGGTAAADFVVIKKASPSSEGAYIASTQDLQEQEELLDGSRFWEAALADLDADDDEDEDYEGEDGYGDDEFESDEDEEGEGEDDDVEVEEVVSLLRELAAGLEDEETAEGEGEEDAAESRGAASGQSSVGVQWRQAYLGSEQPPLTLGPLCVKQAAGKGRGLFTTAAVSAGEVLLVGAPLVLLYSEHGTTPENEELAEHLAAAVAATAAAAGSSGSSGISRGLAPWQQQALLQLRPPGGVASSMQKQQQQQEQQELPDLRQLLGPASERVDRYESSSSSDGGSSSLSQQQAVAPQQLPDAQMITQLVFANCTGEEFEDQALVLLRGATSCGHLGIWPAAALINHGCAPNCNAMLLGDRLVVRAAHDIPAATELTLSYLGPQLFAPAAVRQAELKQQWGFDCGCSRCKAEARYASSTANNTLANDLQTAYDRCQELSPVLDDAVDAEDLSGIRSVQRELLQLQGAMEGSIRAAKPPANVRKWLQASAYDLYDLLSLAADQLPPPPPKSSRGGRGRGRGGRGGGRGSAPPVETEALATCARIVGELTPGSSAHVELATEYMVRTEARFGVDHQEAADASRLCAAAITTRYTPISTSMLQLLMDTWAGAALL